MRGRVVFFFASAAASAAYLTVGESFPLEMRALAIALFYAFGTGSAASAAPWLFGVLIESERARRDRATAICWARALMIIAAMVELKLGVAAEGSSLEDVAPPLSSIR